MQVKIGAIQTLATAEIDKVSINLYFQGCDRKCKGCHNPEFWDINGGQLMDLEFLIKLLEELKPYHDALVFLGGEPLLQKDALEVLAEWGRFLGYELWLFTSYELDDLSPSLINLFDYLKCGPYIEELKTEEFLASSNQYLVYLQH